MFSERPASFFLPTAPQGRAQRPVGNVEDVRWQPHTRYSGEEGGSRSRPLAGDGSLRGRGRSLVDVDEAAVLARDRGDGCFAVEALGIGGVRLHRLAEDRAADREADVAVETRAGAQPLVDLLVGRAA